MTVRRWGTRLAQLAAMAAVAPPVGAWSTPAHA